jgi:hypothetical protein
MSLQEARRASDAPGAIRTLMACHIGITLRTNTILTAGNRTATPLYKPPRELLLTSKNGRLGSWSGTTASLTSSRNYRQRHKTCSELARPIPARAQTKPTPHRRRARSQSVGPASHHHTTRARLRGAAENGAQHQPTLASVRASTRCPSPAMGGAMQMALRRLVFPCGPAPLEGCLVGGKSLRMTPERKAGGKALGGRHQTLVMRNEPAPAPLSPVVSAVIYIFAPSRSGVPYEPCILLPSNKPF